MRWLCALQLRAAAASQSSILAWLQSAVRGLTADGVLLRLVTAIIVTLNLRRGWPRPSSHLTLYCWVSRVLRKGGQGAQYKIELHSPRSGI